jgi:hypothetical protein
MSERVAAVAEPKTTAPARAVRPSLTPARTALLQCACACGQSPKGECNQCDKEKNKQVLQRKSNGGPQPSSIPPVVNQTLSSPGRPLDTSTRSSMESRFGHDFGGVRIHDDPVAAESARAVNARAYTVGEDIAFASGQYDPNSHSGSHLLAHELAHTIQQRGLQRSSNGVSMSHDSDYVRLEHEADTAATAVVQGATPNVARSASQPTLSRAPDGTVAPAKSTTPKPKQSSLSGSPMTHIVTPTEVYTTPTGAATQSLEEYDIDVFYMPATKGPNAYDIYNAMAGKGLESTVEIQGTGKTKTALWQERPVTADLQDIWLQKVGWVGGDKNDLWSRCGGDKIFPQVGGKTCQMDHIVELQIGGNNTTENLQPLDATQNQSSGGSIKGEIQTLALAISNDSALSSGTATQIKLRFKSVKQIGTPEKLPAPGDCPLKPASHPTCLRVEECAKRLPIVKSATGSISVARVDYDVTAGGRPTKLKVPATYAGTAAETVKIATDAENDPSSTLIPGMLLKSLSHRKGFTAKPDNIEATIDDRDKTRLPITIDPAAKPFHLIVGTDGNLTLNPADKTKGLAFQYKYLSPGKITSVNVDDSGETSWKGTITPKVPFIGPLGVEYSKGSLLVTKGLDEAALKKKSVLGMRLTKAQIQLALAPEFKPSGVIEMAAGPVDKPIATASLTLEADSIGLVATGKIKANIPKLETAESVITYKGGADRDEWNATINIQSENIKLGSSITVSGGFQGTITSKGLDFTGKITASLPGGNTAELGLKKTGTQWILFGTGTFKIPKLDETKLTVTYYLGTGKLVATGSTGFTIPSIGLSGKLSEVTITITEGQPLTVSGKGGLDFKKGKAEGHVDVTLHPSGKFSGMGKLSYKLKDNIIVTGTVELDEKEKLRVTGELLITRYEIFKQYGDKRDLFSIDFPIPIPGLSIGTSGVVFKVGGGVSVSYSFGPGTIEPLKFSAGFDPLEADPDLELTVTGTVKVPAEAKLSAYITGSLAIQVSFGVGSAGVEGGLKLQGDLILRAGAFANLAAAYKKKRFSAKIEAGIDAKLLLGLALSAYARAWAGAFGIQGEIRKDWILAQRQIDTRLGFYVKAPFEYADDTGIKLPEFKDIEFRKPELTMENAKRIIGEIFSGAPEKVTES